MFSIDWQIHVSDLIVAAGCLVTVATVFLRNRDSQRDTVTVLKSLVERVDRVEGRMDSHHEWLIAAGLDRRRPREERG